MTDQQNTAAGARPRAERLERLERGVERRSAAQQQADDERFSQGLAALRAYAHAQGDTLVPDGHLDADGFPLAAWVAGERIAHLEGELSDERRAALEGVPGWQWEPVRDRWHRTGENGI
ncbi:helicase [Parafrankia colletiae]|uniref:Helicase n=1 Tax=Parafrankia colletiae TaxID=573497 RepID=A0A1S1R5B2_9ACTN|nr:helicase associated domain-containing protein [Parafrankia colletiae]MCK9901583.1 helicase associated domain-containing protein [Frankia sp. Cpl3]OHV41097.1 helicase [Parafrankia colletiae]